MSRKRHDAVKQFHEGGDRLAELIEDRQPTELPVPDTEQPMVSRSVRRRWTRTSGSGQRPRRAASGSRR